MMSQRFVGHAGVLPGQAPIAHSRVRSAPCALIVRYRQVQKPDRRGYLLRQAVERYMGGAGPPIGKGAAVGSVS